MSTKWIHECLQWSIINNVSLSINKVRLRYHLYRVATKFNKVMLNLFHNCTKYLQLKRKNTKLPPFDNNKQTQPVPTLLPSNLENVKGFNISALQAYWATAMYLHKFSQSFLNQWNHSTVQSRQADSAVLFYFVSFHRLASIIAYENTGSAFCTLQWVTKTQPTS